MSQSQASSYYSRLRRYSFKPVAGFPPEARLTLILPIYAKISIKIKIKGRRPLIAG